MEVQKEIVAEIEDYQEEIMNYERGIRNCHAKIAGAINRVWDANGD